MTTKNKYEITVVQMGSHFLYLPFYYAQHENFFDYIPTKYHINKPILPHIPRTDENAFKELMENGDIHFAICDPIQILNAEKYDQKPVVLSSLVTNSAFWAVNHKTFTVNQLKDLGQYNTLISYPPGTTSYEIAKKIHKISNKHIPENEFIEVVQPSKEIEVLLRRPKGTIALSPNPLDIEDLIKLNKGEFKINLSLSDTSEYQHVLVTALLSKEEFVNQHQELIVGLLKAIQHALLLIGLYSKDKNTSNPLIMFIDQYFGVGRNAEGALKMALRANVFPSNIEVKKIEWENSVRANYSEQNEEDFLLRGPKAFEKFISPYCYLAKKASAEVLSKIVSLQKVSKSNLNKYLYLSVILFTNILALFYVYSAILFLAPTIVYIVWRILQNKYELEEYPKLLLTHQIISIILILWIIAVVKIYQINLGNNSQWSWIGQTAVTATILGWEITTLTRTSK